MTSPYLKQSIIWLSISKEINTLENNINKSPDNERRQKLWLSLSERLIYLTKMNISDENTKKITLGIIRYLRCLFFWNCHRWDELEYEVNIGIKEDVDSSIYLMIKGFIYLRPLANPSVVSEVWSEGFPFDKKKELLAYAQKCFKKAIKKSNSNQGSINIAIKWTNAWMLLISGNIEKSEKCVLEVWSLEENFGEGWSLWMRWLGGIISEKEHIKLIKCLKNT